uniref:hypothetical protein n=1 Tax=Escherichia coli TaxID=562 RepID=UPI002916269C
GKICIRRKIQMKIRTKTELKTEKSVWDYNTIETTEIKKNRAEKRKKNDALMTSMIKEGSATWVFGSQTLDSMRKDFEQGKEDHYR